MNPVAVKIAHISDLHLSGWLDRRQISAFDRLLEHFTIEGFDHIVISGDLSNGASTADWKIVKDALARHGLYHWEKATVVAGNHDLTNLEEEMRFYNALNPFPAFRMTTFRKKLAEFCSFFSELITGNGSPSFPFIKVLNYPPLSLAIVAVNSVHPWFPADNPLGARGEISSGQLRALVQPDVLDSLKERFVIGLCHHAYRVYGTDALIDQAFDWTMELKNRDEFLNTMKLISAQLVLHGHFHRFQTYMADGIPFVNGGSFRYDVRRYCRLDIEGKGNFSQKFAFLPEKEKGGRSRLTA
ncbi:MAG: metallophosphoesterase [Chlorobiaceae bacterium]|nr:metallophosphoesterase [Chlorobiaceae bacterium]NTV60953.1 metallophosphoesterase [Chlorobiaceae bacterium]